MSSGDAEGELVFVYGTLRRGASEGARMAGAVHVGRRLARGQLIRIEDQPALVDGPDPLSVVDGDLFRVPAVLLEELDSLHGLVSGRLEGDRYARIHRVVSEHGYHARSTGAWTWVWTGPMAGGAVVKSGDWMDVELPRRRPLFTWVTLVCALGLPGFWLAAWYLDHVFGGTTDDLVLGALLVMAMASPVAGCFAGYLGERRREDWSGFRFALLAVVMIECVPVLIMTVALLPHVSSWFR